MNTDFADGLESLVAMVEEGRFKCAVQDDMFAYWRDARRGAKVPPLAAIDPLEMPRGALPHVSVVERDVADDSFRVRLTGDAVIEGGGMDLKGKDLNALEGFEGAIERYRRCVRSGDPYWVTAPATFSPKKFKRYSALGLPFGDPDRPITRLLMVMCFYTR